MMTMIMIRIVTGVVVIYVIDVRRGLSNWTITAISLVIRQPLSRRIDVTRRVEFPRRGRPTSSSSSRRSLLASATPGQRGDVVANDAVAVTVAVKSAAVAENSVGGPLIRLIVAVGVIEGL